LPKIKICQKSKFAKNQNLPKIEIFQIFFDRHMSIGYRKVGLGKRDFCQWSNTILPKISIFGHTFNSAKKSEFW